LCDGGPECGRRTPGGGGESDAGPPGRAIARAIAYWNTCRVRRKTGQAPGSRGPQGLPVASRGRDDSVGEVPRAGPSSACTVGFHELALDLEFQPQIPDNWIVEGDVKDGQYQVEKGDEVAFLPSEIGVDAAVEQWRKRCALLAF